jgi:hypothetical protein
MIQIVRPKKQKAIVVVIAGLIALLGLESMSLTLEIYQLESFFRLSLYVYLFLIFLQSFIFDLHLKDPSDWSKRFAYMFQKQHLVHFLNYLVLPFVIYWSTVVLLYLNPFEQTVKQVLIFSSTIAIAAVFWYLKGVFYEHKQTGHYTRQPVFLAKLYASFVAFTAALGISRFHGQDEFFFAILVFGVTFFLLHQAIFQHHYVGHMTIKLLLSASTLLGVAAFFLYLYWGVNYFSGAVVLTSIYNTIWGLIHHKYLDRNLTREIAYEYLAVLFVILVIIFSTTNFAQRI